MKRVRTGVILLLLTVGCGSVDVVTETSSSIVAGKHICFALGADWQRAGEIQQMLVPAVDYRDGMTGYLLTATNDSVVLDLQIAEGASAEDWIAGLPEAVRSTEVVRSSMVTDVECVQP